MPLSSHTYTTAAFRNIVRRSLGIQEDDGTGIGQEPGSANSLDIVNDAFERVWREHRWQFQMADPVTISYVADQARYALPDDFMELIAVTAPGDRLHRFESTGYVNIRTMREKALVSPINRTFYSVVSDPPATLAAFTRYALELFPTPLANLADAAIVDYYRECPKVCEDTDIPPFPVGFHSLLKQAVRLEAFEQENDPRAAGETAKFERMLVAAKDNDGRHMQTNLGSLINAKPAADAFDNFDLHHDYGYEIPD
jgi:hypothetical protein